MPQIVIQNITKTYTIGNERIDAVRAASLEIEKGDFLSIVGHSGSGKTTLLSLIGGITRPSSGAVFYDGTDIQALGSDLLSDYRCEKIGFMFQFASLLPMLTVKENLLLPSAFRSRRSEIEETKAKELLSMVGLVEKINAYPPQLSGGQQRRVAIARAFMNSPEIILADEPTGDLDEDTEMAMMDFFRKMNRTEQITFVMVTHNTDLARRTQRQFRMSHGVIRQQ